MIEKQDIDNEVENSWTKVSWNFDWIDKIVWNTKYKNEKSKNLVDNKKVYKA